MDEERTDGRVQTLAGEQDVGGGGAKEYLDYDGLECLVKLLKERIAAVDGDGKYLPLTGGTVTGDVYLKHGNLTSEGMVNSGSGVFTEELISGDEFEAEGAVYFYNLTENADAPNVVVADSTGRLYKAPVSSIAGPDMNAITDAEIDALF